MTPDVLEHETRRALQYETRRCAQGGRPVSYCSTHSSFVFCHNATSEMAQVGFLLQICHVATADKILEAEKLREGSGSLAND